MTADQFMRLSNREKGRWWADNCFKVNACGGHCHGNITPCTSPSGYFIYPKCLPTQCPADPAHWLPCRAFDLFTQRQLLGGDHEWIDHMAQSADSWETREYINSQRDWFNKLVAQMKRGLELTEQAQRGLASSPGLTEPQLASRLDDLTKSGDFSGAGNLILHCVRGCHTPFGVNTILGKTPTLLARRFGIPDQLAPRLYRSVYKDEHLPHHLHGSMKEDRETQCCIDAYALSATWRSLPYPEDAMVPFYRFMAARQLQAMLDRVRTLPVVVEVTVVEQLVVTLSR